MNEAVILALVSVITLLSGVIGWSFKKITNAFVGYVRRSQTALDHQSAALDHQSAVLSSHCLQTAKEHRQIVKVLKALNGGPKRGI